MTIRSTTIVIAIALGASAVVSGQTKVDRAFSASGASCEQITWSKESLNRYPQIASACREVMQRDGKYFVKFEGKVKRVADGGRQLTIDFRDGDLLTLTPPANMNLYIDNKPMPIRSLRPGDELNFYVPEDQLAAEFFQGDAATATAQEVPISNAPAERVAMATPAESAPAANASELPRTASALPAVGLAGLLLVILGGALTARRRWNRLG
jgi:hypothetical protein